MPPRTIIGIFIAAFFLLGCSFEKIYQTKKSRPSPYEQIDFHALVKRYLKKDKSNSIEGIYSVSGLVTKKGKSLMG